MKKLAPLLLFFSSVCSAYDNLELLIGPDAIEQRIAEVAAQINREYDELTIIMVMKGAVCVTADLIRHLDVPFTLEYMRASSYGERGTMHGELKITGLEDLDLASKNVLIVDDIFDTGNTMTGIVEQIEKLNPKSLKTLVLLVKNVSRETAYRPDYVLFDIENRFVIGYGLDYKELYRGLRGIYAFINDDPSGSTSSADLDDQTTLP